jgi:hypothetical protein
MHHLDTEPRIALRRLPPREKRVFLCTRNSNGTVTCTVHPNLEAAGSALRSYLRTAMAMGYDPHSCSVPVIMGAKYTAAGKQADLVFWLSLHDESAESVRP